MEDEVLIKENFTLQNPSAAVAGPLSFFGVFDGHGGRQAAIYTRDHLFNFLREELEAGHSPNDSLIAAFLKTDHTFIAAARGEEKTVHEDGVVSAMEAEKLDHDTSGTTAVAILISHSLHTLWVAHVGDSRAVLLSTLDGSVRGLTNDHKADRPDEVERIRAAGGFVVHKRVMGELAISRAIGDVDFKEKGFLFVLADPEVNEIPLNDSEDVFVLACDGLYDVMTNEKVGEFIKEAKTQGMEPQQISETIVRHAIDKLQTRDNVTTIIVDMKRDTVSQQQSIQSHTAGHRHTASVSQAHAHQHHVPQASLSEKTPVTASSDGVDAVMMAAAERTA